MLNTARASTEVVSGSEMLERKTYQRLFSTPLFHFQFPEHQALNEALVAESKKMRAASDGVKKSNKGGWHSEGNIFDSDAPSIKVLRALSVESIEKATKKISRADLSTLSMKLFGWMNSNPPGGYNAPHTHPGAHWSGVYYVTQPDVEDGRSGMIEFLDPRSDLPNWRLLDAPAFQLKKTLRPMPGDLLLFPSYLVHWVYPNDTDAERISVAFNATFGKSK